MKAVFVSVLALAASALARPAKDSKDISNASLLTTLFPNYLVPINEASPNTAYPTQFTADISFTVKGNETRMFVGFDVPSNGATSCAISFTLPPPQAGEQFPWTVTGTGQLDVFQSTNIVVPGTTTWNTKSGRTTVAPLFQITEPLTGGDATITGSNIACNLGQRQDFEVLITHPGPASFEWFELSSPKTGITLNMFA